MDLVWTSFVHSAFKWICLHFPSSNARGSACLTQSCWILFFFSHKSYFQLFSLDQTMCLSLSSNARGSACLTQSCRTAAASLPCSSTTTTAGGLNLSHPISHPLVRCWHHCFPLLFLPSAVEQHVAIVNPLFSYFAPDQTKCYWTANRIHLKCTPDKVHFILSHPLL